MQETALHPFAQYVNPELGRLMHALALDVRYVRGEGCWLVDDTGMRVLDGASGYGSVPFGHNPSAIWDAVDGVRRKAEPSIVQPSLLDAAGELARRLCAIAPPGMTHVTLTNSGAESVEAALKLARSAVRRPGIVATHGGFHGKTLGALSATGRPMYQAPFYAPVPDFHHVPYGDADALARLLHERQDEIAAVLVEPIQGEGGIVVPPPGYLAEVRALCDRARALLIFDEVQTGLGRTGRMFAAESAGVVPDIMTLAKALGGGLVPAGAVLCTDRAWTEDFALRHTSTFGGNTLSARVGIAVLDLLEADDQVLVRQVAAHGDRLKTGLVALARRYPQIVTDVRGEGFFLGMEFTADATAFPGQSLIGAVAEREALAQMVCTDLLHRGKLRVAPTVFGSRVVRVEPPLVAGAADCDAIVWAVEQTLEVLASGDAAELMSRLVGRAPGVPRARATPPLAKVRPMHGENRWAFVVHPLDPFGWCDFDESLAAFDAAQLTELSMRLDRSGTRAEPATLVLGGCRVHSRSGRSAYGELIGLPLTADQLLDLPTDEAVRRVRAAIEVAAERGAHIVGLGAYTSIVCANGNALGPLPVAITTGNGFTVAAAIEGLHRAAERGTVPLAERAMAIVGATGAIGRAAAVLLAEQVPSLLLVANPHSGRPGTRRAREVAVAVVAAALATHAGGRADDGATVASCARRLARSGRAVDDIVVELERAGRLVTDATLDSVAASQAVLTCTSTPRAFMSAEHLANGAVVCDVARPLNVMPDVAAARPDVTIFEGGVIDLPDGQSLGIRFGLPERQVYACMAETILLSLEGTPALGSGGAPLDPDAIRQLASIAQRHDFRVSLP